MRLTVGSGPQAFRSKNKQKRCNEAAGMHQSSCLNFYLPSRFDGSLVGTDRLDAMLGFTQAYRRLQPLQTGTPASSLSIKVSYPFVTSAAMIAGFF
jgi:hypothetical protein